MSTEPNFCAIVPAYQEAGRIGDVVLKIRAFAERVVVVDDGSTDGTGAEADAAGALVLAHGVNRGKGAALQTGFEHAQAQQLDFVITLDADGQHDPAHIPEFVDYHRRTGCAAVIGNRMGDPRTMPWVRKLTNRFMSQLLSRQMGQRVDDTQSGYRLYATSVLTQVRSESGGYAAESEVLLNLAAAGVRIGQVPIRVIYGDEQSKIRPVRDALQFWLMLRAHAQRQKRRRAGGGA